MYSTSEVCRPIRTRYVRLVPLEDTKEERRKGAYGKSQKSAGWPGLRLCDAPAEASAQRRTRQSTTLSTQEPAVRSFKAQQMRADRPGLGKAAAGVLRDRPPSTPPYRPSTPRFAPCTPNPDP